MTLPARAQIVSNIQAEYRNGQMFITWKNIPSCDTGFYYVYQSPTPIVDSATLVQSTYLGRVPYNFSWDFRLSYALGDPDSNSFLITNDTPYTLVDTFHNLFVTNCTVEGALAYFAVRAGCSKVKPFKVVPDSNATTQPVVQHMEPITCYLQKTGVPVPGSTSGETMAVYLHYGTNVSVPGYPAMTNEGCLPFHFSVVKSGPVGGNNAVYLKFHGGKGNFIDNMIATKIPNSWKIGFDDWIPAFNFDPKAGFNTRWLGYSENFNIYKGKKNDPFPSTGVIRAYTYYRIRWELDWLMRTFPGTLDTQRIYLVGNSQGCAGVILLAMLEPHRFAAGNLSESRFWVSAPDDTNPNCKFNNNGSARKETRALWGHEDLTNLPTDIPKGSNSDSTWKIYDLTNMPYMLSYNRFRSLPFLRAVNGKEDKNTCWQEKLTLYDSVTATRHGGVYMWDLREHGGGSNNAWPTLSPAELLRFATTRSYPAFSHSILNGNPGADNVTVPPYYNGDPIGSLHANLDWVDSSIIDSDSLWQVKLFVQQRTLNDLSLIPLRLPEYAVSDVTLRRTQAFRNFPDGTELCWFNFYRGRLIQSGKVVQQYTGGQEVPLTIKQIKIFPDGNTLRVQRCDLF
ncbi:MAG: hypothetical protein NZM08_03320 [Chitinophagales bacterium]|nr:hypothetical protein [Chitinophagales bacterium]